MVEEVVDVRWADQRDFSFHGASKFTRINL